MHPQMTNMQASAHDASSHIFASAGALVFVNAYAGSAAVSAPSHAFAAHKLACPLAPLSHTLGEHTCSTKCTKHLWPSSASTGLMPHMMCAYQLRAPSTASTAALHTRQKPLMYGWGPCTSDARENRSPLASNSTRAPSSLPCAHPPASCSCPSTP